MKKSNNKTRVIILIMMMAFALPMFVYSQPSAPDDDDIDTPIDGGISLVLAAGAAFGVKQMRKKKNQ